MVISTEQKYLGSTLVVIAIKLASVIGGYSYRNKIFRVFVIRGYCYLASFYMTCEECLFSDFVAIDTKQIIAWCLNWWS